MAKWLGVCYTGRMTDFVTIMGDHDQHDLSLEAQKRMGAPIGDDMPGEHKAYLGMIIDLLDRKEVDLLKPETILHRDVYAALPELDRSAIDVAVINIIHQVTHIEEFYRSPHTPNAAPQLRTMIDHLKQQIERIEAKYGDVFKI